jgi:hypothetical protein
MPRGDLDFIGVRGKGLAKKLDELGRAAGGRSRSQILRYLVLAAKVQDLPRAWTEVAPHEQRLVAAAEMREKEE